MSIENFSFNSRSDSIPEALSIYINQIVYSEKRKGIDIITLSLGEAFFDIPCFSFDEIDFAKGYHYSDSMGLPELRTKIIKYYNSTYKSEIHGIENVLISSGSKIIIYMLTTLLVENGNEVLIHEPAWLSYKEQVKLAGGIPRFIPYSCKCADFGGYMSDNVKMLILNNPNNPAGWVYDKDSLIELYSECKKRNIFMLVDEAYSDFVVDGECFASLANISKDLSGVAVVNSLSKNMGMSGWRIGYVISDKDVIKKVLKLNQHMITCAPTVLQMYLARYFDDILSVTMPQVKETVKKRNRMLKYLDSIGLKYLKGGATFYIFIDVHELKVDTLDFCLYLIFKYGIATVPGSAYGISTKGFIRVGVGAESEERLKYAFDVIKTVYEEQKTDTEYVNKRLADNGFWRFEENSDG